MQSLPSTFAFVLLAITAAGLRPAHAADASHATQPNIVFILADDKY